MSNLFCSHVVMVKMDSSSAHWWWLTVVKLTVVKDWKLLTFTPAWLPSQIITSLFWDWKFGLATVLQNFAASIKNFSIVTSLRLYLKLKTGLSLVFLRMVIGIRESDWSRVHVCDVKFVPSIYWLPYLSSCKVLGHFSSCLSEGYRSSSRRESGRIWMKSKSRNIFRN